MSKPVPSLAGVWVIETARGQNLDGEWVDEKVIGGAGTFTPDGKICTFVKTTEYTFGFFGKYLFDGKTMTQIVQASNNPEFEGGSQNRELTFIEPNLLKLSAIDEVTGLRYELSMRKSNNVT